MTHKTKLELIWIGKDKRPCLEPRILLEDKELSYRADPLPAGDYSFSLGVFGGGR